MWPPCECLRAFSLPPHPRPGLPPTPHATFPRWVLGSGSSRSVLGSRLPAPVCGKARPRRGRLLCKRGRALRCEERKPGESLWRGRGKEKPPRSSLRSGQEPRPSRGDPRPSTGLPGRGTRLAELAPIQPRGPRCPPRPLATCKLPGDTSGAGHDNYMDKEAGAGAINQRQCMDFRSVNPSLHGNSLGARLRGP